jgi:CRISPR system Cascade subunit CasE
VYLSRVQLNLVRKGAHKLLGSPQALHAAVLSSFPQSDAERGRVLWRVDRDSNQTWLYVVSTPQPDFTHIVEQAGWPMTQGWAVRDYAPLLDSLAVGQEWEFRLTANPTHLARIGKDGPLKRMGHVTVDHQQKWLLCRCGDLGFEIPVSNGVANVVVHDRLVERFQRRS